MTYQPIYRGTRDALEADKDAAQAWLEAQLQAVAASLVDDSPDLAAWAKDGDGWKLPTIKTGYGRDGGYIPGFPDTYSRQRPAWYYEWTFTAPGQYKRLYSGKLKIRKDGTLNPNTLRTVIETFYTRGFRLDREADHRQRNVELYEKAGSPLANRSINNLWSSEGLQVSPSIKEVGKYRLQYRSRNVRFDAEVPVGRLAKVVEDLDAAQQMIAPHDLLA